MLRKSVLIVGLAAAAGSFVFKAFSAEGTESGRITETEPETPTEMTEAEADSIANSVYGDLDEVVVTGLRPVVSSDGATTTYNVSEDPGSAGTTLLDMLRKVPMVSVDAEDKITLKGESNFKILVNGKEDPTLSANASQIFKMMPASAISKIEVITEPGAKYDAEGTGGIINLVTATVQSQDGYNIGISGYGNNRMSGGSVNARAKHGNITVGGNIDYANGRYAPQKMNSDEESIYLDEQSGAATTILAHDTKQKTAFDYIGGGIKLSWEPTSADLFSIDASVTRVSGNIKDAIDHTAMHEAINEGDAERTRGGKIWEQYSDINGGLKNLSTTAMGSYQHNFPGNKNYLAISYQFSYGTNKLDTDTRMREQSGIHTMPIVLNHSLNINREHTVQADYTNDFNSEHHLLETGIKGIFRRNSAFGTMMRGESEENLVYDRDNAANLSQIQDIKAIYASYTGIFGNINTKAGVRYEQTRMGNRYHIGEMSDFTRNLNDIVPNAAVSYSFGPAQNLRLAYQMRISRPTAEQINPFTIAISNYIDMQGNPDLKSEHNNNVSLTYSQFGGVIGGNIGLEYSQTNNAITNYVAMKGNRMVRTYGNMGKKQSGAINGFLAWTIIPRMSATINGRAEYVKLKSESPYYNNHGWQGNFTVSWNYMLLSGWGFSAYGGMSTERIQLQGHNSGYHYYGLAANKKLLRDKSLTVGVSLNNFLEKDQTFKMKYDTHNVRTMSTTTVTNWNIGVNLSWNFGNLNSDVKRTSVSIVNDDKSSTGGNSIINNN